MSHRLVAAALLAGALAAGCGRGSIDPVRGACDYGQVEVGNTCVAVVGRQCDRDGSCLGGSCIVDGDQRYCTTECAADAECPATYVCTVAGDKGYCQKDRGVLPGRCRTGKDCPTCAVCTGGVCRPSQVCVEMICTSDDQCGTCRRCDKGACAPISDCGPACASSFDCLAEEVCTFDYQGGLACLPRTAGAFSAPCSLQSGVQCESNVCLYAEGVGTVYETYCSVRCTDTQHSADCPPGFRCRDYPPFGADQPYCVLPGHDFPEACASGYRCPADLTCRYGPSLDQDRVVSYCADGVPDGRGLGRSCSAELTCRTGICPANGLCTEPCATDNDCPEAYNCMPLKTPQFSGRQLAFEGCLYYTFVKGAPGDLCPGGDDDCDSGICVPGGAGGPLPYCAAACTAATQVCPAGFWCQSDVSGAGRCVYEQYLGGCSSDADCQPGEACASDEATGYRLPACRAIKGDEGTPGAQCAQGASLPCTSGLCLSSDTCSAFCRTADDCPAGDICSFGSINLGTGEEIVIKACFPDPGSLQFCTRDAGCPAADEVCRAFFWSRTGEVRTWCRRADPAWKADAEPCADGSECASGVCLGNAACTSVCAEDTDCGPGEACAVVASYYTETYARPARACRPAPAAGETGQPCTFDAECTSGLCFTGPDSLSFCADRCRDNRDCAASYTVCRIETGYGNICTPADYRPVE